MAAVETASLQLPKDLIEAIVQREVSTAIVTAMGGRAELLDQVITRVLTQKVDEKGLPSTYSYCKEFITWAMEEALRRAVRSALEQEVENYREMIRQHLATQLSKRNSPLLKQIVDGMTTGMVSALENKWRLNITYDKD